MDVAFGMISRKVIYTVTMSMYYILTFIDNEKVKEEWPTGDRKMAQCNGINIVVRVSAKCVFQVVFTSW